MNKTTLIWSTKAVRAARAQKDKPSYVPCNVWHYYKLLRPELGMSINGVEFEKLPPAKQKKTLDAFEDFFERFFFGDAAEEMWGEWAANYKSCDAIVFVGIVLQSHSELDVFRNGVATTKKNKSKNKLVAASKKLRKLIKSEHFIVGLESHCMETTLLQNLEKFEAFVLEAEYGFDASMPDYQVIAQKEALSFRKTFRHADFLRLLATQLRLGMRIENNYEFLRSVLECFYPAPADVPYTVENIRRIINSTK